MSIADENQIKKVANGVFSANQNRGSMTSFKNSNHTHNGSDSPRINQDDVEPGSIMSLGFTTSTSEIFTIEIFPGINQFILNGISANGLGQKASLTGSAAIGNTYRFGNSASSTSYVKANGGQYGGIIQNSSSVYIDTTDLTKARVNATGNTGDASTGGTAYIVWVQDAVPAVVASLSVIDWTNTTIKFQSVLATNWYITAFLNLS